MGPLSENSRSRVLHVLRALEPELKAAGVRHISLFGSIARGDDCASSDVDLALDFAPGTLPNGFQFVTHVERLRDWLSAALSRDVDVVILPARRRALEETLRREAVPAF
jgi:predicted nucleotidyltransferase